VVSVGLLGVLSAFLVADTGIRKEWPMRLQEWEGTVQTIVDECCIAQRRVDRVLMAWRARLEKEPTLLKPYQIDEIVREVRQRLNNPNR
jgi:hypothetical protein